MKIFSPLLALALAGCSVIGIRGGTEEPAYRVVAHAGPVEIRQYAPRLAAGVTVQAGQIDARSEGFRRLAGFIFGGNTTNTSISMTAPVAQSGAGKIAMTAPVAQSQEPSGAWTISFFMPAKYTIATLPKPNDPGISITEIPAEIYAVYRFSGSRGAAAEQRANNILLGALKNAAWRAQGQPVAWFYDPPWTLPFARRNEVAVLVTPRS